MFSSNHHHHLLHKNCSVNDILNRIPLALCPLVLYEILHHAVIPPVIWENPRRTSGCSRYAEESVIELFTLKKHMQPPLRP